MGRIGRTLALGVTTLGLLSVEAVCPSPTILPAGFLCAYAQYGYVADVNGNLWVQSGANLVRLAVSANNVPPAGFVVQADLKTLVGPGGDFWQVNADRTLFQVQQAADNGPCPASRLPAGFSCSTASDNYVIGPSGNYFVVSGDNLAPLTVSGTEAPIDFDWSTPGRYDVLTGPDGKYWRVNQNGSLTNVPNLVLGIPGCNGGLPLPAGYRCAGFGYGYILDDNNNYYSISAQSQLVRVKVVNGVAPQGFTVLPDQKTLQGPQGPPAIYDIDPVTLELVIRPAAKQADTSCPQNRLPPGYRCASPSTTAVGNADGLFGYVVNTGGDDALRNRYFTIVDNTLVQLSAVNGAVPPGFQVAGKGVNNGRTLLTGPDQATTQPADWNTQLWGAWQQLDNVLYQISANGLVELSDDSVDVGDSSDACEPVAARLPTGYSCATNFAQGDLVNTWGYVMGPSNNYYVIANNQLNRLTVINNVAPPGFTVVSSNPPTLSGPVNNGLVYTLDAKNQLVASNPELSGTGLGVVDTCPASRLPPKYQCPSTGIGFGYVMGQVGSDAFSEYFVINGNTLERLRVVNNQAPPGFTVLPDKVSLKGPVINTFIYTVGPNGVLQSKLGPTPGPTVGFWCEDQWGSAGLFQTGAGILPSDDTTTTDIVEPTFTCARTVPWVPSWCSTQLTQTQAQQSTCTDAKARFAKGIEGGEVTLTNGQKEMIQNAYNYVLGPNKNYFVITGRNLLRLAVKNGETPPGFAFVPGSTTNLVGPDADATSMGFQYTINADGTLQATGGSTPLPTILSNVCPAERLPVGYSCVEDYTSVAKFGFYIRNDKTTSLNLFRISTNGQNLVQLTLQGNMQVAPLGFRFKFDDRTIVYGPAGHQYTVQANGRIDYDHSDAAKAVGEPNAIAPDVSLCDGAGNCFQAVDYNCGTVTVGIDGLVIDPPLVPEQTEVYLGKYVSQTGTTTDGEAVDATNEACVLVRGRDAKTGQLIGAFPVEYIRRTVPDAGVDVHTYFAIFKGKRVHAGSSGTTQNPQVPKGWGNARDSKGRYSDPSNRPYHFVYVNENGYSAQVVYEDL